MLNFAVEIIKPMRIFIKKEKKIKRGIQIYNIYNI